MVNSELERERQTILDLLAKDHDLGLDINIHIFDTLTSTNDKLDRRAHV